MSDQERDLKERWEKLRIAESVLQNARDEISDVLDDIPDDAPATLRERIREILGDQSTRPSPDFRMLLINAHKAMLDGDIKEVLRLTDVARLSESIQVQAMRAIIEEVYEDLDDYAHVESITDNVWRDETMLNLRDAHDKPAEYLARLRVKKR